MERLPPEVLERVLMYLPPSDRMNSALTCRRWAQALNMSTALEDIWLKIRGCELGLSGAVLIESHRQYRNLQLSEAHLVSFVPAFWTRIGRNLRKLELNDCSWSPQVLYKILRECSKLESLTISISIRERRYQGISFINFELPEEISLEEIQRSMNNVHHLHLGFYLTGKVFAHLLTVMPNVKSISLARFEERRDLLDLIPSLLGTRRVITELDLELASGRDEYLIQILRVSSATLEKLHCYGDNVTREAYEAIGDCSKLRILSLTGANFTPDMRLDDNHLRKLLLNASELESLEVYRSVGLTDGGLLHIREHKKLRKLCLNYSDRAAINESLRSLGQISSLQYLDLQATEIDVRALLSIASLPNLRTFKMTCYSLNSECLKVLFEKLTNLETLHLMSCEKLSDADVMKLCRFEKLKSLIIQGGYKLTDLTFRSGIGSQAMESLWLEGCSLTDEGLASIGAHHSHLKTLVVCNCRNITEAGLVRLLRSEPLLKELKLFEVLKRDYEMNKIVTVNVLETLEKFCPRLRFLRFDQRSKVNEEALHRFKTRRPRVQFSNFRFRDH